MRRQHLLTVGAALHGSEDILEVAPHPPKIQISALGQAHPFQSYQSLRGVLLHEPGSGIAPVLIWVPHHCEERRLHIFRPQCIALDGAVKGRVAVLVYLSTLRRGGVELRTIPKLACAEIFRGAADALPDIVPAEA